MLGFGKKKRKDADAAEADGPAAKGKKATNPPQEAEPIEHPPLTKKRFITKKQIFILLMVLGAIGASAYWVYTLHFTEKTSGTAVYQTIELPHVKLPEEMVKFSFDHFPDLYISLVNFNAEISLFIKEIQRIEAIAQKYPEQKKITDTGKKELEKGKNTLIKEFSKLEKPIKETYVLFQVDETQGLARIKEKKQELTDTAQAALNTAQEQTKKITPQAPQVPEGMIQGTLHKLKKKFL